MKLLLNIFLSFLALFLQNSFIDAKDCIVVEGEFQWRSSNLILVDSKDANYSQSMKDKAAETQHLGKMAYNNHFESFGSPPPLDFLDQLQKGAAGLAEIKGQYVIFRKTDKQVPLNTSIGPKWTQPANPFLMSSRELEWVFLVYPYYICQSKDNRYCTEVYSKEGRLLYTFHSFPTHLAKDNPYLLVSPERSGCCDSLKWSIRFYDLHKGSVSEYSCPEGFCGDVLFSKLGVEGPFVLLQEIIGVTSGVGGALLTNIYIIDNESALSASGKIIYAFKSMIDLRKEKLAALAPFSISKLCFIEPTSENESWNICFKSDSGHLLLKLTGKSTDIIPAVVLLQRQNVKDDHDDFDAKLDGVSLGKLPLLAIVEPGNHRFRLNMTSGEIEEVSIDIKSDYINKLFF